MTSEAADNKAASLFSVNQKDPQDKFDPSELPTSELTQLWTIAAQRGMEKLCSEIEDEKRKRKKMK